MSNISIFKATYYMGNSIGFTDMTQELVAKTFPTGSPGYETCNIYKTCKRRCTLLWMEKACQIINTMIRNFYHANIRFNGAEREISRFCPCLSNCIKQCTFAHVWETYNTNL